MAVIDIDNLPEVQDAKAQRRAVLGYVLGIPRPGATPPFLPSQPAALGERIQPPSPLGKPVAGMKVPTPTSPLAATLGPNTPAPASPPGANASAAVATLAPGSLGMPNIPKPTPEESAAAGRAEYKAGLPNVTAAPNTADFYNQQAARLEYQKEHPWGSPISSHPGTLGKIGHTLATIGNVAGDILDPRAMELIPGTQLNREAQLGNAVKLGQAADEAEQRRELNTARLGQLGAATAADKTRQTLDQQRLDNLKQSKADKMLTHGVDENGQAVVTFQRPDGSVYSVPAGYKAQTKATQPKPFTNPFEAFAYGSAAEKKAAQDFLALEKRTGAQYRQPSEVEERYRLYKQDPKAYAAMFGTKGTGGITQATATKMLNYFQRRRKEIPSELGISPYVPPTPQQQAELKQKLAELDALAQPFMDAAQGIQPSGNGKGRTSGGQLPPGWTPNPR